MTQTMNTTPTTDSTYSFIADAGIVTREELAGFLGIGDFTAGLWLRRQVEAGYIFRDEFGLYRTSCPWPRVGL